MTSPNDIKAIDVFTDNASDRAILALETDSEIFRFVYGLRGPRKNPVTRAQIVTHMFKLPMFCEVDIEQALSELVWLGKITCEARSLSSRRKWNGAYDYSIPPSLST